MQYFSFPIRKRKSGNAITEYCLPGVTMLCICMAGLSMVSASFKGIMHGFNGEMNQQISDTKAQQIIHEQERQRFVMLQNLSPKQQFLGNKAYSMVRSKTDPNALCSGDWCIDAPGMGGATVNTAGTNGQQATMSSTAANIFAQVAAKIQAEKGDPALVNLLTQLANQGHAIAGGESNLEGDPDYATMYNGATAIQNGRTNFTNLSNQLNNVIMQLPEESRGIVADASTVIKTIAGSYSFDISGSASSGNVHYSYSSSSAQLANSVLTNINANSICSNGGDTSKCIK